MEKFTRMIISVVLWLFVAFCLILAIGMPFGIGTFLMLLAAVMAAPLMPVYKVWDAMLDLFLQEEKKLFVSEKKHAEKKKANAKAIKTLIIALVFLFGFVFGMAATENSGSTDPSIPAYTTDVPESSTASTTVLATDSTAESPIESATEQVLPPTTAPTTEATTEVTTEPTIAPVNSTFEIHFIDVGQADAALVLCDGKAMLIDGGNVEDSSLLYTYLKNLNINHLNYVVGTHAHEDHIGGLAGALNYATVDVAYCPATSYDTKAFGNFVKALNKHGVSITVPSTGDSFDLGSATCSILAVNTDRNDANKTSIVLRITYGDTSFMFTGDAEREVEQAILNRGGTLKSTVLKVGHHGSESSTSYVWLREIMPQYAVISVGKGNSYGHPTEAILSRLRDADVKTYRTDMQGDIVCVSDGKNVTFTVDKNANADVFGGIGGNSTQKPTEETQKPTEPPEETEKATEPDNGNQQGTHYVLNTSSKKFHYEGCHSAKKIADKNRDDYYGDREDLIDMGYSPCGNCDP